MRLHKQYGHVVRISPKKLLISDKGNKRSTLVFLDCLNLTSYYSDMITQILSKDDMHKADIYLNFQSKLSNI
jgi:hypothetical protein